MTGIVGKQGSLSRKAFLAGSAGAVALLASSGPFGAVGARVAQGQSPSASVGYGPLVEKGDIALPAAFNYQVVSRQGVPMSDGNPTPGIFDAMGAFQPFGDGQGSGDRTILIRNHENRRRPGEIPVITPVPYDQDPTYDAGCTKLVVERNKLGKDRATGQQLYEYNVVESFAIQSGTDTNCAGGVTPWGTWITCEEVYNRSAVTGKPHGYIFEIDAFADGPVEVVPVLAAGRFVHEAAAYHAGILYETEDQSTTRDSNGVLTGGACFYRYIPEPRSVGRNGDLAETTGPLQALKLKNEFRADMDRGRVVGQPYEVEWVTIEEPNPQEDTNRTPQAVRFQGQRQGAAVFDREEGLWIGNGKVYFDCTSGGNQDLGQIWEYDPGREVITLIFESTSASELQSPDNITIVPKTQDIFICEDGANEQFVRGLTQDGEIYDFARTLTNDTEFCGAVFDPDGQTLYLNQQGERGGTVDGPPNGNAVTYAIYGPFEKRAGANNKNFGNGQGV